MKPTISEFSFGYALTEALRNLAGGFAAAPVFPSLLAEGKAGGGYDVKLKTVFGFTFVQFKLSDCMVTKNAFEAQAGYLPPPFSRIHLRPTRHSQQHQLLLDLEKKNPRRVLYAAPLFHTEQEFNKAYLGRGIISKTAFFRPSAIGPLPDDKDHHVSVCSKKGKGYFCSVPREIESGLYVGEQVTDVLHDARERTPLSGARLKESLEAAWHVLVTHKVVGTAARPEFDRLIDDLRPLDAMAYLAATYFECQMFVLGPLRE